MLKFHSFISNSPIFLAPLIEGTVFSPSHNLAYFVIDYLTISVWVDFWAFYSTPFIYVSVFVPLPYCYYYSFVL